MREIKFRVWNDKIKAMYYPVNTVEIPFCIQLPDKESGNWYETASQSQPSGVSCELMQYTCMDTVDGKNVYEGDKFRIKWHYDGDTEVQEYIGVVVFDDAEFSIENENDSDYGCSLFDAIYNWGELIGNIHENPELLGEVKT